MIKSTQPKYLAFHNDPAIKAALLARLDRHIELDELQAKKIGQGDKGCAIWCSIGAYKHSAFPERLGIPVELAHIYDYVFEGLSASCSRETGIQFSRDMYKWITVGADLALIWPKIGLALLEDPGFGVIQHVQSPEYVTKRAAIEGVIDLYRRWIAGDKPPIDAWQKARASAAVASMYNAVKAVAIVEGASASEAFAYVHATHAAAAARAAARAAAGLRGATSPGRVWSAAVCVIYSAACAASSAVAFWLALRDRLFSEIALAPIPGSEESGRLQ